MESGYHQKLIQKSAGRHSHPVTAPPPPPPPPDTSDTVCGFPGCKLFPHCALTEGHSTPDWYNPMMDMLDSYKLLDRRLSSARIAVYPGYSPQADREYYFLFCELRQVPEYYQQVLDDKDIIRRLKSEPIEKISKMIRSKKMPIPKSLAIGNRIVAKNNLFVSLQDLLDCLNDICTEGAWRQRLLNYKMYKKYLLEFLEENRTMPDREEILEKYCSGLLLAENGPRYCTVWTCNYPGSGKTCLGFMFDRMEVVGQRFFESYMWTGASMKEGLRIIDESYEMCTYTILQEGLRIIDESYEMSLRKPCASRANYIKAKLKEAEKTGLAKEIERFMPFPKRSCKCFPLAAGIIELNWASRV